MSKGEFLIYSDGLTSVVVIKPNTTSIGVNESKSDMWCIDCAIQILNNAKEEIEELKRIERCQK